MKGKHIQRFDANAYNGNSRKPIKPINLQTLKESLKTVTKEYCEESSICGLKHLVNDNTPYIERIIWIVTLIGALLVSVSLVWMTFQKYYRAPLVTTQLPEGIPISEIIFPAVSICTNNRISKGAAINLARTLIKEEHNKKYTEQEMLLLLKGLGHLFNLQPNYHNDVDVMELHDALGDYDVNKLTRDLTPKCEDILVRCAWNDTPKKCSKLFDFRLTMNGYCCTFNYLRTSDIKFDDKLEVAEIVNMYKYGNKSSFNFDEGLKVLLWLNESDDFYYDIPLQGAKLQFSDAYDFPDGPSGSYAMQIISPSVQMLVNVAATFTEASRDIQHVPVTLRRCLFYDESSYLSFYTYSDCMLKCRMLFILRKCNCTPFNMPKLANVRTCDLRDVRCLKKYYVQSITVRPHVEPIAEDLELEKASGGLWCPMCYPSCTKATFSYDFYNVNIYPKRLNTIPDSDRTDWLQGSVNFTRTSTIIHVKYAKEVADCYEQNVIMKWFDLFSNIGSTCGFVTGFSFVSVLEFLYFFTVKLIRDVNGRRRWKHNTKSVKHNEAQFEKLKKYTPIYWNELTGPATYTHSLQNYLELYD